MGIVNRKKEFNYFSSFFGVGEVACQAADYLHNTLKTFNAKNIDTYTQTIHKYENDADAEKHDLCNHLLHEFMPPIEREDISLLSQEIDNIIDLLDDVMRRIYMFNITEIRPDAIAFSELTAEACGIFCKLLNEFSDFKKSKVIRNYIIEINTLENKGDKLHSDSIRSLFLDKVSYSDQLAWTMIFESLENSIDACERAADIIDEIITKNT